MEIETNLNEITINQSPNDRHRLAPTIPTLSLQDNPVISNNANQSIPSQLPNANDTYDDEIHGIINNIEISPSPNPIIPKLPMDYKSDYCKAIVCALRERQPLTYEEIEDYIKSKYCLPQTWQQRLKCIIEGLKEDWLHCSDGNKFSFKSESGIARFVSEYGDDALKMYSLAKRDEYFEIKQKLFGMGFNENEVINRIQLYHGTGKSAQFVYGQLIHTFTRDKGTTVVWEQNTENKNDRNEMDNSDISDEDNNNILSNIANFITPIQQTQPSQQSMISMANVTDLHPLFNGPSEVSNSFGHPSYHPMDNSDISDEDNESVLFDNDQNNIGWVAMEDSYEISVDCHVCRKHFTDIFKYRDHLKRHYDSDVSKTWKVCDFNDCDYRAKVNMRFIAHIAKHTNETPYKCKVIVNGAKCNESYRHRKSLRNHYKTHFKEQTQSESDSYSRAQSTNSEEQSSDDSDHSSDEDYESESNRIDYVAFEDSHYFSVQCFICHKFFSNFEAYNTHMQCEYDNDPKRSWLRCDLGCDRYRSKDSPSFIAHLATHTKARPYHCNVIINGTKCESALGEKKNMKTHWKNVHLRKHFKATQNKSDTNNKKPKHYHYQTRAKHKRKRQRKTPPKSSENENMERNIYFSVDCFICDVHFDDFGEHRNHVQAHYDEDPLRTWLTCDFGCQKRGDAQRFRTRSGFMYHFATHTKTKPWKCNFMIDGSQCTYAGKDSSTVRKHWISKHKGRQTQKTSVSETDSVSESDKSETDTNTNNTNNKRVKRRIKRRKKRTKYVSETDSDSESDKSDSETESETDKNINTNNKRVKRRTKKGKRRCGRLLLDDALKDTVSKKGWSNARVKAFNGKKKSPNAFYYRFNEEGQAQKGGEWSLIEHTLFMQRVLEIGVNDSWGIFSTTIPGRVGYMCSNYWKQLIKDGDVHDPNYYWDKQKKAFKFKRYTKTFKISNEYRKYAFTVKRDKSNVWRNLPKKHPKHPSKNYYKLVEEELSQSTQKSGKKKRKKDRKD